jgi:hypothetical protein
MPAGVAAASGVPADEEEDDLEMLAALVEAGVFAELSGGGTMSANAEAGLPPRVAASPALRA